MPKLGNMTKELSVPATSPVVSRVVSAAMSRRQPIHTLEIWLIMVSIIHNTLCVINLKNNAVMLRIVLVLDFNERHCDSFGSESVITMILKKMQYRSLKLVTDQQRVHNPIY